MRRMGRLGTPDEIANARKFIANPDWPAMLRDTQAAIDAVRNVGPVGIVGFCMGGALTIIAATQPGVDAYVSFYGFPPAGAAPLAAILTDPGAFRGRKVALVLSGGNIDPDVLERCLKGE